MGSEGVEVGEHGVLVGVLELRVEGEEEVEGLCEGGVDGDV